MSAPFWSDDFDMDLPKVIPDANAMLGELADVELFAAGRPDRRFGNLNHPSVWNSEHTMLAFFGFKGPSKPAFYSDDGSQVRCTAWEAFRDAWPHGYLILVEQKPVWDTFQLQDDFNSIMFDRRGWRSDAAGAGHARNRVRHSIAAAVERLRAICLVASATGERP